MNVAGPSRLRGSRPIPDPRETDNHEEDLTRMIAELALYDNRERRGKGFSDREVAFRLLMQNARELAEFNADLALAQRLADGNEEANPTPGPATAMRQMLRSNDVGKTRSEIQIWNQLVDSFLSTPISSGQTTPNPGQVPTIIARAPR
ncbi:uncharacterized protein BJ212DRAFT_1419587 [Suillus subaureus]|uniref:Uncharacterized protein n=1 Tax=Suillus subaureus TaxID=48587 RepID=A0A9P7DFF1_9AGAM|nr:uncharacterized protein BJ212DRAFT_1419587 [Suillus subaureus]KAG1791283.1 hypothetical protein BJ212DRAFT_1419587 [Suillus subaureus]